ncbi:GAF domain-containing protein [Stakelama pacifica]|uniref:GAF domain-containing protein n=1 Tax=Stakelama pacifica TaxID=517720 RepID=UPI0016629427|nr:GAF domain-containing protein [Stakelama pacifica]
MSEQEGIVLSRLLHERRRRIFAQRIGVGSDEPPIALLDRLVERAANAFGSDMAAISIIEGKYQWFRTSIGVGDGGSPMARSDSFCTHTIKSPDVMEVVNPNDDPRFAQSCLVRAGMRLKYYIGAPLILTDGLAVGALCVLDCKPHSAASADQRAYLAALARQAANEIEIMSFSRLVNI